MRVPLVVICVLFLASERAATLPFGGTPRRIPGVVEAEDFDEGEAGVAYHDVNAVNEGADYRGPTQVDIERRPDASNGHGIGWTRAGEWLVYTVEVNAPGPYTVEIPVASAKAGGRFHIEFDGVDATGPITVPDTGGWGKLQTIRVGGVRVPAGRSVMKVVMDANGESMSVGDIDCFRFSRPPANATPPTR
ncbi:MAG: carbohydrate-binding protein [Planctomycetes bacterium]|nr:carbohydrate-binding protein [Planctomycetota bacterium]MBM4056854.1 carbohydrate-binding protein [Planctomycetota bacterium]